MSESAKTILQDFDRLFKYMPKLDSVQEQACADQYMWNLLNRAIDCLREHVELGILT